MQENYHDQPRIIEIDGEKVVVTEAVYREYMRPIWRENKRREREKRCKDEKGNRCTDDCSFCEKDRTGRFLSLERVIEDGYEAADTVDVTELAMNNLLIEELNAALNGLEPKDLQIAQLFGMGLSEREIAGVVGLSQKGVNKRKNRIFEQLRARLKYFE